MKNEILDAIQDYWTNKTQPKTFVKGKSVVPVSGATIDAFDIRTVADALLEGWFTEWKYAAKFSSSLSRYSQSKNVILCNSGSSANLLAFLACAEKYKRPSRRKVITCATGFPTTISPIILSGYEPLFVDVDPETLNPRADDLLKCLEDDTTIGIVTANTLGFPIVGLASLTYVANQKDKFFINDCCDALGWTYDSHDILRFGTMSTLSFFPAHQITTGEGGAVLTDDDELAEITRCYAEWGRDCNCKPGQDNTCGKRFGHKFPNLPVGYDHKYTFSRPGFNLKMTELSAALGYSQLQQIGYFTSKRQQNYQYLYENLVPLQNNDKLSFIPPVSSFSPFGFPITAEGHKQELVAFLEERKIRTRPVFGGNLARQPMMNGVKYSVHGDLSGSDYVMNNTFWVGVHPELTDEMLDWVIESMYDYVKGI